MARTPIALQLYSIREDCARDLPGTLAAVAKMGYEGVEFAGYYERSAKELRKLLDGLGLKAAGAHIGLDVLLEDQLPRTIEFHQQLGNQFLVIPWVDPRRMQTRSAWADFGKQLTEIAGKLKPYGMHPGYHNHSHEFKPIEGETPWDTLAANSSADVVMQLDIGNCLHGGGDAMALLKKWAGRALTVHLKDYSATNDKALVGEGEVPWSEVFEVCEAAGNTQWYIVEQESYPSSPLESVEGCVRFLKTLRR
jgi:sugar phosphate isomerase/epimerase